MNEIIQHIRSLQPPFQAAGSDIVKWRHNENDFKNTFSAKATWSQVRLRHPPMSWTKLLWFPYAIPRYTFITWLALRDRLSTGSRTSTWGAPQACPFCGERNETRDHLFFACHYVFNIWPSLCSKLYGRLPTPDWSYTIASLLNNRKNRMDNTLYRMIFQTTIYQVWRERNSRIHNSKSLPYARLTIIIAKSFHDRILSRYHLSPDDASKLGERWKELFPTGFASARPQSL